MSLCLMTPMIGGANETFVRRHVNDLLPGRSAVVALREVPPHYRFWDAKVPKLILPHVCQTDPRHFDADAVAKPLCAFWKKHKVDVVLAEYLQFAVQFAALARRLGIRFYAHAHGLDCSAVLRDGAWREKYLELRHVAGIIVVSHAMKAVLTGLGIPAGIIHRIPCGVDASEFVARPDRSPRIRFLAVGRLTGKKGPIFLLDSFRRAFEGNPEIELNLVGDGELAEAVRQFVQAFSLTQSVKLHSVQPPAAVQELIRSSDVFVQHSVVNTSNGDEEGLPVSILEAMGGGLPVVSTMHAGIPEAVVDGVTGFLVPERDTCAMAERMSTLARCYRTRLEMGRNGLERVRSQFTWEEERRLLAKLMQVPIS